MAYRFAVRQQRGMCVAQGASPGCDNGNQFFYHELCSEKLLNYCLSKLLSQKFPLAWPNRFASLKINTPILLPRTGVWEMYLGEGLHSLY